MRHTLRQKLENEKDFKTNYLLLIPRLIFANGHYQGDILFEKKNCVVKSWMYKNEAKYTYIKETHEHITKW